MPNNLDNITVNVSDVKPYDRLLLRHVLVGGEEANNELG